MRRILIILAVILTALGCANKNNIFKDPSTQKIASKETFLYKINKKEVNLPVFLLPHLTTLLNISTKNAAKYILLYVSPHGPNRRTLLFPIFFENNESFSDSCLTDGELFSNSNTISFSCI